MKIKSEHAAASVLLDRWSVFISQRHQCLSHDDVDNIHDLRVATRRLRAVVQLFAPYCSSADLSLVYPAIKSVTREIGTLRNIDEALLFIKNSCLDKDDAGQFAEPLHSLSKQRNREAEKVHRMLKQLDVSSIQGTVEHIARHLPDSLINSCNCSAGQKFVSYLTDYNLKLFHQVQTHIVPASAPEAVDQRHALRIAIKKWRYFLEILAELTNRDYSATLTNLRLFQSILGSLNDLSVFYELFNDIGLTDKEQLRIKRVAAQSADELNKSFYAALTHQPIRYEFLL